MSEKRRDNKGRILRQGESQRKDLTYMFRYTDEKKKRQTLYAPTLQELRHKEDEIAAKRAAGLSTSRSNITVIQVIHRLMDLKKNLRQQTLRNYNRHVQRFEKWQYASMLVVNFKMSMAKEYMLQLEAEGYCYGTISNAHQLLREAFAIAYEDDLVSKNPFDFKLRRVVAVKRGKRVGLTPEEQTRFLEFIKESTVFSRKYNEVVLLLHTGMRIGELCALTINDIDWDKQRITVNKQLIKEGSRLSIGPPKTENGNRILPLDEEAYAALAKIIMKRNQHKIEPIIDGVGGFIMINGKGNVYSPFEFDAIFRRARKAYNKRYDTDILISPHVLRHTFCTNLVRAGIDIKSLQYLMGHSSVNISLDTYTHFTYDDAEAAFKRIRNAV